MSTDGDDKYPTESGRRRFVKGVVGGAVLSGLGTSAGAAISATTQPSGRGGGITPYYGVENIDGPAPRGMPQIPVRIDDEGFLRGLWPDVREVTEGGRTVEVARTELADIVYSNEWFQYCGVQTYPGIAPGFESDNYFHYAPNPPYEWQREEVEAGARVNVADFEDYETWENEIGDGTLGKPALVTWRSQGVPPESTIPVQLIRSPLIERRVAEDEWLRASVREGFIAVFDKCTHFCCVPGFKAFRDSERFDAGNDIYCQCHQSVYDPFSIVRQTFVALPRPGE